MEYRFIHSKQCLIQLIFIERSWSLQKTLFFCFFFPFFPQLVAGPIERATNLLPQILNEREFKYEQGVQGIRLILLGMFKKVVIADSLAPMVDQLFSNYQEFEGGVLLLGKYLFCISNLL